jgi:hypothetical protein
MPHFETSTVVEVRFETTGGTRDVHSNAATVTRAFSFTSKGHTPSNENERSDLKSPFWKVVSKPDWRGVWHGRSLNQITTRAELFGVKPVPTKVTVSPSWDRPVTEAVNDGSAETLELYSRFAQIWSSFENSGTLVA